MHKVDIKSTMRATAVNPVRGAGSGVGTRSACGKKCFAEHIRFVSVKTRIILFQCLSRPLGGIECPCHCINVVKVIWIPMQPTCTDMNPSLKRSEFCFFPTGPPDMY